MKWIAVFLVLLIFNIASSQVDGSYSQADRLTTDRQIHIKYSDSPVQGSAYFDTIYQSGKIIMNGKALAPSLMRYNAYTDEFELNNGQAVPKDEEIKVDLGNNMYRFMNYMDKGGHKREKGYLISLNEGNVVLFLKTRKKYIKASVPKTGFDSYEEAKFKNDLGYYLLKKDRTIAEEIKLNKKNILKEIDNGSDDLKKYISDNNLDLKEEKDAVRVLDFYNSLQIN